MQKPSESALGSSSDVAQLREDMNRLRDDVRTLGESLSRLMGSTKEKGRERAQEEVDRLLDELRDAYGSARERGRGARASLESEIEERPFTSVAGAFIVGIILGKLFSTR